jgi:hypothetical protein
MYEAVIVFTLDTICPWYVDPILAPEALDINPTTGHFWPKRGEIYPRHQ